MQTTFFYLERSLKKLADGQCSSITKGSIYHTKHMYIQPFTTVVDWPDIRCLMEVTTMFYICRYCVFTWYGRYKMKVMIWIHVFTPCEKISQVLPHIEAIGCNLCDIIANNLSTSTRTSHCSIIHKLKLNPQLTLKKYNWKSWENS